MSNKYSQDIQDICADYIRTKIREISESHYSAGWMSGIEYTVWNATQSPTRLVNEHEAQLLRAASEVIGGWIAWSDHIGDGVFVPMSEWRRMQTQDEPSAADYDSEEEQD
jgi:hypothetical protein